jgi:xanthine dehydrogenase molybdopterin-binding subunit B/uncharacterized membrane protein YjjB (DUF3815 family)
MAISNASMASTAATAVPGGIGAGVPRVDGRRKVTGAVEYGSDVTVKAPLHAYFHTSAIALGRILEIDEGEARALPGVVEILTWRNTAGQLQPMPPSKGGSTSITVLESPEIRHDGQIVAVILGEDYETARDASHRLRVRYDRRQPTATFGSPGLTPEVARSDARFENPEVGDAAAAFAAAPVRIDQRYATPTQHHNALELFTTTAQWDGDELTVHEPSQFMVGLQHALAASLRIEPSKVRVLSRFVGGAFGSKGALTQRTALVALAARRLGRPVKMVATRDQSFTIATYRAETRHRVRLAATRDGRITALVHEGEELSSRPDAYKVGGTETTARMYAIPNIASKVTVQHADRNTPGFMRAPAEVPYMFALESAMDELAIALGIASLAGLEPVVRAWRPQPDWVVWTSLAVGAYAFAVLFRAHRRDYPLVMLAAIGGYLVSRFGGEAFGPEAGIFLSALAVTAAGNVYGRISNRPGALVRVPGLIMLVPGSTALRGVITLVQAQDLGAGQEAALAALNTLMALLAGLLFGNLLVGARRNL